MGMKEEPRVGVYVCHCGINIAGVIDIEEVVKYAKKLKDVVVAKEDKYICSDPGQETIKKDILEHKLNRVVIAACSPRMHEPTFRTACQEAGLNPYLLDMANIREHASWVHMNEPEEATQKAKDLVRMSVAKAKLLEPLENPKVSVIKEVLVIGGGIAGIQASLDLAEQGFKVYLVEKTPSIGGVMAQLDKTFPTMDCSACILTPKMVDVSRHPNIELLTYSEVKEVEGYIGNFQVKVEVKPRFVKADACTGCGLCVDACPIEVPNEFDLGLGTRKAVYVPFPQAVPLIYTIDDENCVGCGMCDNTCDADAIEFDQEAKTVTLNVGTIIVATGFKVFDARRKEEYGYGVYDNVITGLEFERLINASGPTGGKLLRPSDGKEPKSIGFVQCVGSRDKTVGNPYCSRVCCMYAIKHARLYKEKYPDSEIYIFYIDIRAFGKGYEEFYQSAQEDYGVKFIRGRPGKIEEDSKTKNLIANVEDTLLGKNLEVELDLVVLSVGMEPPADADELQKLLRISRGADGFFMEAHPKLRPVDTLTGGLFLAGTVQGPKDIPDTVVQGSAAASRAAIPMAAGEVEVEPIVASIDTDQCIGCKICERVCDFGAIEVVERKARVNDVLCKGCGGCAGACPTGAMQIMHFNDDQIMAMICAAFEEES
ncbi:MAG: CoB--CoM heterodisulfide reductase iron-sulfur subunit A family protein [Candidatus Hydrothermarchaeaceae archaeon]